MSIVLRIFLAFMSLTCLPAQAQVSPQTCGPVENAYGPFDYRGDKNPLSPPDAMPHLQKRALVENYHFTPRVEQLIGSQGGGLLGNPGADLDYTLRAFPNNPRALISVMRYGEREKSAKPPGLRYPVECYFERAIRFQPNDNVVRMVYTMYLTKNGRKPDALQQLSWVVNSAGDNAFTHYNAGLLFLDLEEHAKALTQAHRAIALGLGWPDLRDKLKTLGKWAEPGGADAPPKVESPPNPDAAAGRPESGSSGTKNP